MSASPAGPEGERGWVRTDNLPPLYAAVRVDCAPGPDPLPLSVVSEFLLGGQEGELLLAGVGWRRDGSVVEVSGLPRRRRDSGEGRSRREDGHSCHRLCCSGRSLEGSEWSQLRSAELFDRL